MCLRSGLCCSMAMVMAIWLTIERRHRRRLATGRTRTVNLVSSIPGNVVRIRRTERQTVSVRTNDPPELLGGGVRRGKNLIRPTLTLRILQVAHPFFDFVCLRFCRKACGGERSLRVPLISQLGSILVVGLKCMPPLSKSQKITALDSQWEPKSSYTFLSTRRAMNA